MIDRLSHLSEMELAVLDAMYDDQLRDPDTHELLYWCPDCTKNKRTKAALGCPHVGALPEKRVFSTCPGHLLSAPIVEDFLEVARLPGMYTDPSRVPYVIQEILRRSPRAR